MRQALQREVWRYNNRSVAVASSPQLLVYDTTVDMSRQFLLSKSRTCMPFVVTLIAPTRLSGFVSRPRRKITTTQQSPHWLHIYPQNCPFLFDYHHTI